MIDDKLIYKIKLLGNDYRNGSALLELLDWCNKSNLYSVTQEEAEIFYILYSNIVKNTNPYFPMVVI
jgi:hypothetical protein